MIIIFLLNNSLFNCRLKIKSKNSKTSNSHLNLKNEKNRNLNYKDKFEEYKNSLLQISKMDTQEELNGKIMEFENTFKTIVDAKNTEYAQIKKPEIFEPERTGFGLLINPDDQIKYDEMKYFLDNLLEKFKNELYPAYLDQIKNLKNSVFNIFFEKIKNDNQNLENIIKSKIFDQVLYKYDRTIDGLLDEKLDNIGIKNINFPIELLNDIASNMKEVSKILIKKLKILLTQTLSNYLIVENSKVDDKKDFNDLLKIKALSEKLKL